VANGLIIYCSLIIINVKEKKRMIEEQQKQLRSIIKSLNLLEQEIIQIKMEVNKLRITLLKGGNTN
jgi:regulator of RNase E activity RraB